MFGVLNDKLDLGSLGPAKIRERVQQARHDAHVAKTSGTVRLFTLSVDGLERARDLLERVPKPVAQPLRRAVDGGLEQFTRLPIESYDELNVKRVSEAIVGLSVVDLERVERYERANKARKTVFKALEKERERLLEQPAAA